MALEFELKLLKLASDRRKLLAEGEALLKSERAKLDIEKYFNLPFLCESGVLNEARVSVAKYKNQLTVERSFYAEFHRSYELDLDALTDEPAPDEKERVLQRSLPRLRENDTIRTNINDEKTQAVVKLEAIISLLTKSCGTQPSKYESLSLMSEEDISEIERLISEVDHHLESQYRWSKLQRKRGVDGQRFLERFFNMFNSR